MSASAAGVSCTGEAGVELRQRFFHDELDILSYGTQCHTEHSDALGLQFHQSPHPDAPNRNCVNSAPAQSLQRLAHTMSVVKVSVLDLFNGVYIRIHNDKARGRPEMFVNSAVKSLQRFNGKTDFHASSPYLFTAKKSFFDG
jgi:hypothetical protein